MYTNPRLLYSQHLCSFTKTLSSSLYLQLRQSIIQPIIQQPTTQQPICQKNNKTSTKEYIQQSKSLDFQSTPRKNVIQPWLGDIPLHERKTCTDKFKFYLLCQAIDLRYKSFKYKKQLQLATAIIRRESYLAGFKKPVISAHHFHKHLWLRFQNTLCLDPTNVSTVFTNKRNKGHVRYTDYLMKRFPTFLHEVYRHATKKLGLSDSTKNLCDCMMLYAKDEYPNCPICSKLKMTKYQFWTFFYYNGGKLKHACTKPRLTPEHIKMRLKFAERWIVKLAIAKTTKNQFIMLFSMKSGLYHIKEEKA